MYVEGVPQAASISRSVPLVIHGLLEHEHKKTVLHFTVQRNTEYEGSVRSKVRDDAHFIQRNNHMVQDPLILCYGPRRLEVKPVYSQHTRGGGKGVNNVHKFERFFWHGTTVVGSVYGPVIFGKQPCTLLRATVDIECMRSLSSLRHPS